MEGEHWGEFDGHQATCLRSLARSDEDVNAVHRPFVHQNGHNHVYEWKSAPSGQLILLFISAAISCSRPMGEAGEDCYLIRSICLDSAGPSNDMLENSLCEGGPPVLQHVSFIAFK